MQLFCSTVYSIKQENPNSTQELLGNHKLKSTIIRSVRVRGVLSPIPDSGSGGSGPGVDPVKVCGGAARNPSSAALPRSSRRRDEGSGQFCVVGFGPKRVRLLPALCDAYISIASGFRCPELNGLGQLPCRYFFLFLCFSFLLI
jgi:hypothetical protein